MLLARADRVAEPVGHAAALFALFGIDVPGDADLPTAAICWLADTGEPATGYLMHAEPLQLVPDRDCLLAFAFDDDPLDGQELSALIEAFNAHFNGEGLRLVASPAGDLYLGCERIPAIRTQPGSAVIGRSLDAYLPGGDDRSRWRGLLNETQMLLYGLAFNRERELQARPTLGGLWFSGGGCTPAIPPVAPVATLAGDCRLSRGLLAMSQPGVNGELVVEQAPGRAVVRADIDAWKVAVADLERRLPAYLETCDELHLHPGNGTLYRWTRSSAWRLWRRRRQLSEWLDPSSEGLPGPGLY